MINHHCFIWDSRYHKQCWLIKWTHFNRFQLNLNLNKMFLFQQNAWKMLYTQCWLFGSSSNLLTHLSLEKMTDISQTALSNAFSWMKMLILIKISMKFVPRDPIDNIPALVQIMAWHRTGNKPLSEPMMVRLLMHICVTQPQCVKLNVAKLEGLKHRFLVSNPILFIENR